MITITTRYAVGELLATRIVAAYLAQTNSEQVGWMYGIPVPTIPRDAGLTWHRRKVNNLCSSALVKQILLSYRVLLCYGRK